MRRNVRNESPVKPPTVHTIVPRIGDRQTTSRKRPLDHGKLLDWVSVVQEVELMPHLGFEPILGNATVLLWARLRGQCRTPKIDKKMTEAVDAAIPSTLQRG